MKGQPPVRTLFTVSSSGQAYKRARPSRLSTTTTASSERSKISFTSAHCTSMTNTPARSLVSGGGEDLTRFVVWITLVIGATGVNAAAQPATPMTLSTATRTALQQVSAYQQAQIDEQIAA